MNTLKINHNLMVFSGTYKQKYVINKESKELVVEVKLHEREGMIEASQNLYYGTATANGKEIQHKNLLTCVNAKSMAEKIGKEIIRAWKIRAKQQNKILRLKRK